MSLVLRSQTRRELLQQMVPRYRGASVAQKGVLLDEIAATTGYARRYAMWLLNHAEEGQCPPGRRRRSRYGPEVQDALFLAWHAANRICSQAAHAVSAHPHRGAGTAWAPASHGGVPPPTPLHERCHGRSPPARTTQRRVCEASPRRALGRCSNSRSPSARSRSGMRTNPVLWRRTWWRIVVRRPREAFSPR